MKVFVSSSQLVVFLLVVGNLFLSSCNNDKDEPKTNSISLLASTVSYDKNGAVSYSEFYQYDNQGRIIKVDDHEGYVTTIEYTGSTVVIKDSDVGELQDTTICQLDSKGLCTSISNSGDNEITTYQYDSEGYRKSSSSQSDSWVSTITYIVSEGNYVTILSTDQSTSENAALAKKIGSFKNPLLEANLLKRISPENRLKSATTIYTEKTDYQFYLDKVNTIEYENWGISFLGKQNKNPIKQEIGTSTIDGQVSLPHTNTYAYEYDAQGRITKKTSNEGDYTVYTYVD